MDPHSLGDFISYCAGGGKDSFCSGSWAGQGCWSHGESSGLQIAVLSHVPVTSPTSASMPPVQKKESTCKKHPLLL